MTQTQVMEIITRELNDLRTLNGYAEVEIDADTVLLDGSLEIDSLDLAGLVVALESETGFDPFSEGFVDFRTAGELATLFAGGE